jgi:hypothetical protein
VRLITAGREIDVPGANRFKKNSKKKVKNIFSPGTPDGFGVQNINCHRLFSRHADLTTQSPYGADACFSNGDGLLYSTLNEFHSM